MLKPVTEGFVLKPFTLPFRILDRAEAGIVEGQTHQSQANGPNVEHAVSVEGRSPQWNECERSDAWASPTASRTNT